MRSGSRFGCMRTEEDTNVLATYMVLVVGHKPKSTTVALPQIFILLLVPPASRKQDNSFATKDAISIPNLIHELMPYVST